MIVAIDTMASRYGLLPSDILNRASTFDLAIMDAAIAYTNYVNRDPASPPDIPVEELLKIKARAQ
jgi:hypothetical protein